MDWLSHAGKSQANLTAPLKLPQRRVRPETEEEYFERLEREIRTWCTSQPDPGSLGLEEIYSQLSCLDACQTALLAEADVSPIGRARYNFRDYQKGTIRRAFGSYQRHLRSTALELSRSGVRRLRIIDLPLDILRIIFDNFNDSPLRGWDRLYPLETAWKPQQLICHLRLVCRLFYELASPFLFRILRLNVSQLSLDFAERVSKNPCIAAGVLGVQVCLAYRPEECADDIGRYANSRLGTMETHKKGWEASLAQNNLHRRKGYVRRGAQLRQSLKGYHRLRSEWIRYTTAVPRAGQGNEVGGKRLTKYQKILRQGHSEFQRLHQEQRRLTLDGSFARNLASAMARMPNARRFWAIPDEKFVIIDLTDMLNNESELLQFMEAPMPWRAIGKEVDHDYEDPDDDDEPSEWFAEVEATRLLWQIPIALHKAGAPLVQIDLECIPLHNSLSVLCPQRDNAEPTAWDELASACAKVEIMRIWTRRRSSSGFYPPLRNEDKSNAENFVKAILSQCGPHLQVLRLNLGGFALEEDALQFTDPVFTRLQSMPLLRRLELQDFHIRGNLMHKVFSNLGNELGFIRIDDVTLCHGSWANLVDILHKRLATSRSKSLYAYMARLRRLRGGGLENLEASADVDMEDLFIDTEQYLDGETDHNPLQGPSSVLGTGMDTS